MKILVLGGDGYLGWPTAMHFSQQGHDVMVVDNYMRRNLARDENVEPLFEVPNLHHRSILWKELSGRDIAVRIGDLCV
ncbi:MAG: NAD-dependent dehydratase, partial [Gammaproteobacteria bacterium]|nr:NAD-dependent dehydratase [Gammaproteobacteria bacterium]